MRLCIYGNRSDTARVILCKRYSASEQANEYIFLKCYIVVAVDVICPKRVRIRCLHRQANAFSPCCSAFFLVIVHFLLTYGTRMCLRTQPHAQTITNLDVWVRLYLCKNGFEVSANTNRKLYRAQLYTFMITIVPWYNLCCSYRSCVCGVWLCVLLLVFGVITGCCSISFRFFRVLFWRRVCVCAFVIVFVPRVSEGSTQPSIFWIYFHFKFIKNV